ncbi:glyoxylate reductase [Saccharopolyspora shandongensis]|uniref:Glyoxylate reductase n=1 Tax=Saccharopolyspora shandongensis TaxID=418495 RepID=A0A1H3DPD8_9PSEU|nr:D-glycerate dehydrogenase [Saccharopolyspora shandongensis]SDX68392.1 glyoxylate reductase [Saccharopolyspora shandongensis]
MSHPTFLVTTPLPDPGMQMLRAAGDVVVPDRELTAEELTAVCSSGSHDVVVAQLINIFDETTLAAATVRGISNYAVGYDNVDVAAATNHGILVCNTPGVLTAATADLAMLLILATARRCVEADAYLRSGRFRGWRPELLLGADITGASLGLVGFGRIARATAERALGFGMTVRYTARRAVPDDDLGPLAGRVQHAEFDELVRTSDFLSLHVPLNADTHHLIDADVLRAMKPTAYLINTARGPVVNEQALVAALRDGQIAGAGLDVYEHEPDVADGLADLANTTLLPHLGSATRSVRATMARRCAANAIAMARGEMPEHPVNPEAWRA